MNTNKGFFSLLGSGLILAIFALLVRLLNNYIGPLTQVGIRMLIASLIVLPYFLIKKIPLKIKGVKLLPFSILILSFPLYIIFFTVSVIYAKVANAFFYLFTTSLLTSYLLGFLYFKETINKKRLLVALLSITGLILITFPFTASKGYLGIISGIIGGGFWGISNATRKFFTGKINHWLIILYQMVVGTIISLFLAYFFKEFYIAKWSIQSFSLLSLFGVGLVVIQILLFIGFANYKLNIGSVVLASQLVFVQVIGIFILHEIPTPTEILGSLAIIIAIVLSNIDFNFPNRHSHPLTRAVSDGNPEQQALDPRLDRG